MSEPTEFDLRVDAFGRKWLEAHPDALAFEKRHDPDLVVLPREKDLIALYDSFDAGYSGGCPTCGGESPTFEIGIVVPLSDYRFFRISLQYGADSIDIGSVLRDILAVTDWQ